MAEAKLKFSLEVDDTGSITFKRFGKTVDRVGEKGKGFGSKMLGASKSVGTLALKIGKATTMAGGMAIALAAASAAFIAKKSVSQFMEFEVSLARVGNVSSESLATIKKRVQEISPALGTATELVKGYYQVISAGVTEPKKAIELLTEASRVAKVQQLEQGEVVKGIAALMGAYAKELKTASSAADVLFTIERLGITTVGELIPLIGNLANMSQAVGLSASEMAASLAQVSAAGAGTSIATTQLQSLFRGLLKPTGELKEIFKKYGSVQEAIKKIGFAGVLKKVHTAAGGTASGLLQLFGRAEAVQAILQLSKKSFGDLDDKLKEVEKSTGASASAWGRYNKTLTAVWDTFKNTIVNQAILIGEQLAPAISDIIKWAGKLLEKWRDPATQLFAEHIGKIEIKVRLLIPKVKAVIEQAIAWVTANKEIIKGSFIAGLNGIIAVVGGIVKAFLAVGKAIAWVLIKMEAFLKFLGKRRNVLVEFLGSGSTTKPLTEKIDEMTTRMEGFANNISGLDPTITIGFETAAAQAAMDQFVTKNMRKLINLRAELIELQSRAATTGFLAREARAGQVLFLRGEISKTEETIRTGTTGQSLQRGTGITGLPRTGLFFGHKGEVVLNPRESNELRAGTTSGEDGSGGMGMRVSASLNVMYLTGDRQSMVDAADALFKEIERKLKRLS